MNKFICVVLCVIAISAYAVQLSQQRLQRINQSNTRLQTNVRTGQTSPANAQMQLLNQRVDQRSTLSRQSPANPAANRQAQQNTIHMQQTQQQIRSR